MRLDNIEKVAVLGTGTMAPGIAQLCAQSGYQVSIWGRTAQSVRRGLLSLESNLQTFLDHGLIDEGEGGRVLSRVTGATDLDEAVRQADFVIESVAEDLRLKQAIFAQVDRVCAREAILSTNTSGLSVAAIATATTRPQRVIATHFWNPPQLVPLVEVVGCDRTSQDTVDVTVGLMRKIGKTPVLLCREVPGFIGVRLQFALLREALYIVEQGIAGMEDVDTAVKMSFGRRLPVTGPLETCDLGGVDTFLAVAEYLMKDLCNSTRPSPVLAEAVSKGWLGAKSGRGLYPRSAEANSDIAKARELELIRFLKQDRARGGE